MLPLRFKVIVGETEASRRQAAIARLLVPLIIGCVLLGCFVRPWRGLLYLGVGLYLAAALVAVLTLERRAERFVLDGTVGFTDAGIDAQGTFLPLAELRRVEARFTFARGESVGPSGLGNQANLLLIYQRQQPTPLRFNVLIESRAQRTVLDGLLRRWRQQGLAVVADVC